MYTIENDQLSISVQEKGAELSELFFKPAGMHYLWSGDARFWAKRSPILFPIVGALKAETYYFGNVAYHLPRHGFARDMHFTLFSQSGDRLGFALESSPETLQKYPFPFRLEVVYTIELNKLTATYHLVNTGTSEMYFSLGAHPAFRVPLDPQRQFDEYYIEFGETETAGRWPITADGLIERNPVACLDNTQTLRLSHELFTKDALVFKHLRSTLLTLRSDQSPHGLRFGFPHFPYLGLWSGNGGDFVCIEPWCGIADSVTSDQQLIRKEGIHRLAPAELFTREWSVEFF